MSFLRYQEIYPPDGNAGIAADVPAHRLDEFPVGYSSASCTPALLASASPTGSDYAVMSSYWSTVFQRPANSVLTGCLTPGGKRNAAASRLRSAGDRRTAFPKMLSDRSPSIGAMQCQRR